MYHKICESGEKACLSKGKTVVRLPGLSGARFRASICSLTVPVVRAYNFAVQRVGVKVGLLSLGSGVPLFHLWYRGCLHNPKRNAVKRIFQARGWYPPFNISRSYHEPTASSGSTPIARQEGSGPHFSMFCCLTEEFRTILL